MTEPQSAGAVAAVAVYREWVRNQRATRLGKPLSRSRMPVGGVVLEKEVIPGGRTIAKRVLDYRVR